MIGQMKETCVCVYVHTRFFPQVWRLASTASRLLTDYMIDGWKRWNGRWPDLNPLSTITWLLCCSNLRSVILGHNAEQQPAASVSRRTPPPPPRLPPLSFCPFSFTSLLSPLFSPRGLCDSYCTKRSSARWTLHLSAHLVPWLFQRALWISAGPSHSIYTQQLGFPKEKWRLRSHWLGCSVSMVTFGTL